LERPAIIEQGHCALVRCGAGAASGAASLPVGLPTQKTAPAIA